MRRNETPKRRRRPRKRGIGKGAILFLVLFGLVGLVAVLFHKEISRPVRTWLEGKGLLREKRVVILYFTDPESDSLAEEKREIPRRDDVEEEAEEVLGELTRGPKGRLLPTLPPRTRLLGLQIDEGGVARVNFSKELARDHPGGSTGEMLTVYAIVNSLTRNFPQVKSVQLLVEGRRVETLAGHLSLLHPIRSNLDLTKRPQGETVEKKAEKQGTSARKEPRTKW